MSEYFVYMALDDGVGKWEPGIILGAVQTNFVFGPGDLGCFHWERVSSTMTLSEMKSLRLKKKADLSKLMTSAELNAKLEQKQNIVDKHFYKKEKITVDDLTVKPDLSKAKDISKLYLTTPLKNYESLTPEIDPPEMYSYEEDQ